MTTTAERIVDAARAILLDEGSGAVSMRRVATAVGLTPMAIYRHFPNRDALLAQVADGCFAELAKQWREPYQSGDTGRLLSEALRQYLDFALDRPLLYAFLFTEPRAGARRFPDDFQSGASPTLTLLADALTDGMASGEFREDDVWELALAMAAELHGLVQLYHGGRIGLAQDEFRALCLRATGRILDGIRA